MAPFALPSPLDSFTLSVNYSNTFNKKGSIRISHYDWEVSFVMKHIRYSQIRIIPLFLILTLCTVTPSLAQDAPQQDLIPYDTPVVRYDGQEYTIGYFLTYIASNLQYLAQIQPEKVPGFFDDQLKTFLFDHAVFKMAMKDGHEKDPYYQTGFRDLEQFWMSKLLVEKLFSANVEITEEEIQQQYDSMKDQYFIPTQFKFRHIFLQTIDKSEEEQKEAKDKAQAALALIKAGSDFVEVAELYSDSNNKARELGPFKTRKDDPEKAINPLLEETLLSLKPNEVSEIVKTKYGYEILLLTDHTPAHYRPLDKVHASMRQRVYNEKLTAWKDSFLLKHWNDAVEVYKVDLVFNPNANDEDVVLQIYGNKITKKQFQSLNGIRMTPMPSESTAELQARIKLAAKNEVVFNFVATKVGKEMKLNTIPLYHYNVEATRVKKSAEAWWTQFVKEEVDKTEITKEEMREVYDAYPRYFREEEKIRAGQMVFMIPDVDESNKYQAFKAQDDVRKKALKAVERVQNGEKFQDVAKEVSEGPLAEKGGDLGFLAFSNTTLPAQVKSRLFKMVEGEITQLPIKVDNAYYVLQCFEKPEPAPLAFENPEAQRKMISGVRGLRSRDIANEYKEKLVDPEKITILLDGFHNLDPSKVSPISSELPQ
jgi:parvulin-like peptidyl-prolyl isomerase